MPRRVMLAAVAIGLGAAVLFSLRVVLLERDGHRTGDETSAPATHVGSEVCARCHESQYQLWRGSHHDLAMQVANDDTVLGDFDDASLTHFGITTSFFRRGERFLVRTEGPDGALDDYEVAYTFGAEPLQQYLVPFPGGRYQALSVAWDSRDADQGGQRWFHLPEEERIPPDSRLHWTARNHTWNFMCAECHSTDLRKNYDLEQDHYATTWSEIDVACEACHGPGSNHVTWADAVASTEPMAQERRRGALGLLVQLKDEDDAVWVTDPRTGLSKRRPPRRSRMEIETCARCHSRRSAVGGTYVHGRPLMDTHRPALLQEGLYHADGQVEEEVYVYGSFLQSKMYREGVTCHDCHDPHPLSVRAEGNAICASCHLAEKFDTPSHHFHETGTAGARCVECHMPAKTYMEVDRRRDHSFRVPRPDLTVRIGTPNACTDCHTDRSARWAAEAAVEWYGSRRERKTHYGEAIHRGRNAGPKAEAALIELVKGPAVPSIARATGLSLLGRYLSRKSLPAVQQALGDRDPLVRLAAIGILERIEPGLRLAMADPLLSDPIRSVRMEAARVLSSVPSEQMTALQRERRSRGLDEFRDAQMANADRAGSHLNLGVVYERLGEPAKAERSFRTALKLDRSFGPAYVNLADLYRLRDEDEAGEKILRQGIAVTPDDASLHHALGLLLVRQGRHAEGVEALARAVVLSPDDARYRYVYGVGLHSIGQTGRAIEILERGHRRRPAERDLLIALATIHREIGSHIAALEYARKLVSLAPEDPAARRLLEELR